MKWTIAWWEPPWPWCLPAKEALKGHEKQRSSTDQCLSECQTRHIRPVPRGSKSAEVAPRAPRALGCVDCNDVQTFLTFFLAVLCQTASPSLLPSLDVCSCNDLMSIFMPLRLLCHAVFRRSGLTNLNEDVAQCTAEAVILSRLNPCFTQLAPKGFNPRRIFQQSSVSHYETLAGCNMPCKVRKVQQHHAQPIVRSSQHRRSQWHDAWTIDDPMHLQPLLLPLWLFWQVFFDFWVEPFFLLPFWVALLYLSFVSPVVYFWCSRMFSLPSFSFHHEKVFSIYSQYILNTVFNLHMCLQSLDCFMPLTLIISGEIALPPCHLAIAVLSAFDHLGFSASPFHVQILLCLAVLGCWNFGPVWSKAALRSFMFFPSPQLRTVRFQLAALVVRCRDVCTIWGGQGSPSPFQQGGSGPSHSGLGSLLTQLTLFYVKKQTKERETRRELTIVSPKVPVIRNTSGTVVFKNAACRCYARWQFNAAYIPKIRLHNVTCMFTYVQTRITHALLHMYIICSYVDTWSHICSFSFRSRVEALCLS